jgi:serine/threonine-protein kinase
MTPERWREITGLFEAALARDSAERPSFVAERCANDSELRSEVEAMLLAHEHANQLGSAVTMVSAVPDTLGHYEIVRKIGAGGMGDVYLARDTRLDREVALKILPPELADDPTRRARFMKEAKAVAALNHPNIVTVHSVEEAGGLRFMTMELVRGCTLADLVRPNGVSVSRFFEITIPLVDALAAAHQQGITHRDLKPSNVMVADDGRVKVLDFGLAKAQSDARGAAALETHSATQEGRVVGTPAYMSPEQAEGKVVDHRTDIFSLGIVFYELLAGVRPFKGASAVAIASAILRDTPPPIGGVVPEALERIVHRCLAKAPADRYWSARDLRLDLEQARSHAAPLRQLIADRRVSRRVTMLTGGIALAILAALAATWPQPPREVAVRTLAVLPFVNAANDPDLEYLCDGITENLIQRISSLRSLTVMARSTVFNFKDAEVAPLDAGRQLGVDAILAGSVIRQAGRLRITAELVDVATGARLWGNTYDRAAAEVMLLQDEITAAIVDDGIHLQPSGEERHALARHPTSDSEAYEWYLRARHAVMRNTEEDLLAARELLQRAVNRDPQFAAAHGALAASFVVAAVDGFERPTEAFPEAQRILRRALSIDPQLPVARSTAIGVAFFFDWDWATVRREWRTLDSFQYPDLPLQEHYVSAFSRWVLAGPAEALRVVRQLRALDPISPSYAVMEADFLFHTGQLDAAAALYETTREKEEFPDLLFGLAEVRRAQGRFDEAIDARGRAHQASGDQWMDDVLTRANGEQGYRLLETTAAAHDLEVLRARETYVSPLDVARAHAVLGNRQQALDYLEKSFVDRAPGLVFLKVDRVWDGFRSDPRFADAVRRVGLP